MFDTPSDRRGALHEWEEYALDYTDRRLLLTTIGILLLLLGIGAALLGPVEMYCFYLFSEGGRFHYEGFGFGSFMFGNLASQIIGYYLIAMVAIPLGYGHLKVRRWVRTLSLALLRFWLVIGLPSTVVLLVTLFMSKDLPLGAIATAAVVLALSYVLVPWLLIRFYGSRNVRLTFEARDPDTCWVEGMPIPILALSALYLFYAVVLHIPIFFNGLFPFFGCFLTGLQGISVLDVSILLLICLAGGTLKQKGWAWWGALLTFGLLACSTILTFSKIGYVELLLALAFPPIEIGWLDGIPLEGFHLAVFFGLPLLGTLVMLMLAKRHFEAGDQVASR